MSLPKAVSRTRIPRKETRVHGFVCRMRPFGESDVVVSLVSEERGLINALAKGARKSRKRFGGALDYFHRLRAIVSLSDTAMARLESVEVETLHAKIPTSYVHYTTACSLLSLAKMVSKEEEPYSASLCHVLSDGLRALNEGFHPQVVQSLFQTRVLRVSGYDLDGTSCVECGGHFQDGGVVGRDGVLRCRPCGGVESGLMVSPKCVEAIRWGRRVPLGASLPAPSDLSVVAEWHKATRRSLQCFLGTTF